VLGGRVGVERILEGLVAPVVPGESAVWAPAGTPVTESSSGDAPFPASAGTDSGDDTSV